MSYCTWPRREALSSRLRAERGDVVVSVLIIPLAFIAVFGTIHFGFVFHGRNVAAAAAQDALHAAAQFGGTAADGEAAANRTLALFPAIEDVDFTIDRGEDTVTVTIVADVNAPMSWFSGIDVSVTGPAERFYEEGERDGS